MFKVGDKVRLIKTKNDKIIKNGTIVEVVDTEVSQSGKYQMVIFYIEGRNGPCTWYAYRFEHAGGDYDLW